MSAWSITVRGLVQGVGFRPFVFRLAQANTLTGWVLNDDHGVEIYLEGADRAMEMFVQELRAAPPPASQIAEIEIRPSAPIGLRDFTIRESARASHPVARISPDLSICDACLAELFDAGDRRHLYPYINCTNCGPRYTVIQKLPYDRRNTTMCAWKLDYFCSNQYDDPGDRRFHAQPVACAECGPAYYLRYGSAVVAGSQRSIAKAAEFLTAGKSVAVKGLGGYHLACDACNEAAVLSLRERKYRKEKPFALMVRNVELAREIVELSAGAESLLTSMGRPIVIGRAKVSLPHVAPETQDLGVMLPYTPLHHLLFAAGAPDVLVMTSANHSSEPIAYDERDALERLAGIADAFLIGERPIARRVDDSVARAGAFGPTILRRSRGYAPGAVANFPIRRPILALGADLKNTVTLVVEGQAFVSQHIGDLGDYHALQAFRQTIDDLVMMYEVSWSDLEIVHDCHPQYFSTIASAEFVSSELHCVQHHRAHVASVLAEREEWDRRVIGVSFDGTGYGDDGTIWGGEIFVGSLRAGLSRIAHLRPAVLPGGDAAAENPLFAAAGFLAEIDTLPDFSEPPFSFPDRYQEAQSLLSRGVRTFETTSIGRLFDAAAALLGFTRKMSFEGQAAMWLEQLGRGGNNVDAYSFPFNGVELDFRPLLRSVATDRAQGRAHEQVACAFHRGISDGIASALLELCEQYALDTAVLSGGVFQNELLLEHLHEHLSSTRISILTNNQVPPNDGGISLGQAALAAFGQFDTAASEAAHA